MSTEELLEEDELQSTDTLEIETNDLSFSFNDGKDSSLDLCRLFSN